MNTLPQELVDRISSLLGTDDLKNTLLLSHQWQYAAEKYSGAFSDFALTTESASNFLSTYRGRRFHYLQDLRFDPSLPKLKPWSESEVEDDCWETASELEIADEQFTQRILFLFSTLKEIETHSSNELGTSTNDFNGPIQLHLTIFTPTREVDEAEFCIHRCYISWRIHLLSPWMLPSLSSVRSLTVQGWEMGSDRYPYDGVRKLDLRIILDIASRLPNLISLQCELGVEEWIGSYNTKALSEVIHDWAGPRRDSRHDFSKAPINFPSLRHVELDFLSPLDSVELFDQMNQLPNLTKPALFDPFSSSLRLLSYNLRTMNLHVVADETLFWPVNSDSPPSWPHMESLNVMFHPSTPSGSWYFKGLPGVGATEGFEVTEDSYPPLSTTGREDYEHDEIADLVWHNETRASHFRIEPDNKILVPFLTAFAKAASSMPCLKEFALWSPLRFNPPNVDAYAGFDPKQVSNFTDCYHLSFAWGIAYTRPGEKAYMHYPGISFSTDRQIWWMTANWRPEPELHNLFDQIGRTQYAKGLVEYWGADESEGLLDQRHWFLP